MSPTPADAWQADGPADDDMSDQWRQVVSATHLPWSAHVVAAPGRRFRASVQRWWIDDLALVDVECGPTAGTRRRTQIAATDGEFVALLFVRDGQEIVRTEGGTARLGSGDAVVWDSTTDARFAVPERLSKRSLLIPRAALAEVGGRPWATAGTTLEHTPAVRLLGSYLDALAALLPGLDRAGTLAARNATLQLVLGALRHTDAEPRAGAGVRDPDLRAAMERYIDRHLTGAAVTPERIACAYGVSVRTVNRVFSATGDTVGSVLRSRRLARARGQLAAGSEPIGTIAHRWGFFDSSHFTRAFKATYGLSPRDYRTTCRSSGTT